MKDERMSLMEEDMEEKTEWSDLPEEEKVARCISDEDYDKLSKRERGVLTVSRGRILSVFCKTHGYVKPRIVFVEKENVRGDWVKMGSPVCSLCKKATVRGEKIELKPGIRAVFIPSPKRKER